MNNLVSLEFRPLVQDLRSTGWYEGLCKIEGKEYLTSEITTIPYERIDGRVNKRFSLDGIDYFLFQPDSTMHNIMKQIYEICSTYEKSYFGKHDKIRMNVIEKPNRAVPIKAGSFEISYKLRVLTCYPAARKNTDYTVQIIHQ